MSSLGVYPNGYDTVNYSYYDVSLLHPLSDAVWASSSSTDYAQWSLTRGSGAESYVYYTFDLSSIPADATINSVTCSAKGYISVTLGNNVSTSSMQLYSGSTAMGSATSLTTSASTYNMACGIWTRDQLSSCKIKIYAQRGSKKTTTTYYNRFYGATLTVDYTVSDTIYTVTVSCNSGGTLSPSGSVSVGQGASYSVAIVPNTGYDVESATANGVNIQTSLILSHSGYTYGIASVSEDVNIVITFAALPSGAGVYYKQNGVYSEVNAIYEKIGGSWLLATKSDFDTTKRYAIMVAPPPAETGPYDLSMYLGNNVTSARVTINYIEDTAFPATISVDAGVSLTFSAQFPLEVTSAYIHFNGHNINLSLSSQVFYKSASYTMLMPSQDSSTTIYGTIGGGGGEIM